MIKIRDYYDHLRSDDRNKATVMMQRSSSIKGSGQVPVADLTSAFLHLIHMMLEYISHYTVYLNYNISVK